MSDARPSGAGHVAWCSCLGCKDARTQRDALQERIDAALALIEEDIDSGGPGTNSLDYIGVKVRDVLRPSTRVRPCRRCHRATCICPEGRLLARPRTDSKGSSDV